MDTVFILQHENPDTENVKLIGAFRTRQSAEDAQRKLLPLFGFKRYPDGFTLNEYTLDQLHWDRGFGPPDDYVDDEECEDHEGSKADEGLRTK